MKSHVFSTVAVVVAVAAALAGSASMAQEVSGQKGAAAGGVPKAVSVTQGQLNEAGKQNNNWLHTNGDYAQTRYYGGKQINAGNVKNLRPAFVFQTEVVESMETAPIVVDGVMYLTTSYNHIYAVDAATGKQFWHYKHKQGPVMTYCCGPNNRGVAAYNDMLYMGTLDAHLIAIDAKSGKPAWSVTTVDQTQAYTSTGAPRIANGKVIIGNGGAEYGVRGYVSAYDAETGKLAWRFYTVPGDPSKPQENKALDVALPTWKGDNWWKFGGGGTVWDSIVYDPEINLLYVGTGNGAAWNREIRSPGGGDNLYLASILAINPDNGELVWHYQTVPGDTWDYTAVQPMMLADLQMGGRLRKVLMQAPKNGFFYVLDRATGELLAADPYVAVNWASHVDMKTGRPVEMPGADYKEKGTYIRPGPLGGHNWQAMSFSPKTGLVYIPAQDNGRYYEQPKGFEYKPLEYNLGLAPIGRNMDRYDVP